MLYIPWWFVIGSPHAREKHQWCNVWNYMPWKLFIYSLTYLFFPLVLSGACLQFSGMNTPLCSEKFKRSESKHIYIAPCVMSESEAAVLSSLLGSSILHWSGPRWPRNHVMWLGCVPLLRVVCCVLLVQLLACLMTCLIVDQQSLSTWRQVYVNHVSQSRSVMLQLLPASISIYIIFTRAASDGKYILADFSKIDSWLICR